MNWKFYLMQVHKKQVIIKPFVYVNFIPFVSCSPMQPIAEKIW
jgi:hypothetical protein